MNKRFITLSLAFLICCLTLSPFSHATDDPVYQRYIDNLSKGGMVTIKQTAQSIYNTGVKDQEVLDVATEVLLQKYRGAPDSDIDALSWVCNAIGQSENNRYSSALKEVIDGETHRKLKKYAKKAWKNVGKKPKVDQYKKGNVNLAALRGDKKSASKPKKAAAQSASSSGNAKATISDIREGMGMNEVYALLGTPTNTTTHQTGKAWVPFNFGGKDLARTIALYKGQGRVVFSHSAYQSDSKVLEVIVDPQETGLP